MRSERGVKRSGRAGQGSDFAKRVAPPTSHGSRCRAPSRRRSALASAVEAALGLLGARPAASPGVLARGRLPGAVGAADRGIALIVERVVGDVVVADVVPDLLLGPVGKWVQLPEPEALVPAELRRLRASLGVGAPDPRDPAVDRGEGRAHRLDLADPAAGVRVAAPER